VLKQEISRRTLLKGGGAALAGLGAVKVTGPAHAFPGGRDEKVIEWADQPPAAPFPEPPLFLKWEEVDSWLTPVSKFFVVSHYGNPAIDAASWRLGIGGLVARAQSLSVADLRARPRREVTFTLECSGNHGYPFVIGAVGNARWAGTPLAPLLERGGIARGATEVVFWGADEGTVTIRDNAGVFRRDPRETPSPPR
jgi:DMSO/TMAO reductase YedYZ molybdopterin-dependent catalytic subunit